MKLLVVSEGKHELDADSETGALVELLRRMIPTEFSCERRKVSDRVVQQVALQGKSANYEKRLLQWLRYAEREGFDGLALVVDEDGETGRRKGIKNAQSQMALTSLPRAFGLAVRSFDAWMLADEKALSDVLGKKIDRSKNPEKISDPKRECKTLLDTCDNLFSQTDFYAQIAKSADLDCIAKRCPQGFVPFRTAVSNILSKS